jgi:hypothetical protein
MTEEVAVYLAMKAMTVGLTSNVIRLSFRWTGLYPFSKETLLNHVHKSVFKRADLPIPIRHKSTPAIKQELLLAHSDLGDISDDDADSVSSAPDDDMDLDEDNAEGAPEGAPEADAHAPEGAPEADAHAPEDAPAADAHAPEGAPAADGPVPATSQIPCISVIHRTSTGATTKVRIPLGSREVDYKVALGSLLKTLGQLPAGPRVRQGVVQHVMNSALTRLFRDQWIVPRNAAFDQRRQEIAELADDDDDAEDSIPARRLPKGQVYTTDEALEAIRVKEDEKARKAELTAAGVEKRKKKQEDRIISRHEKEKASDAKVTERAPLCCVHILQGEGAKRQGLQVTNTNLPVCRC